MERNTMPPEANGEQAIIAAPEDPRRARPPSIHWSSDGKVGRVYVDDEYWAAVEWSEKLQIWCIEDAEGRCLSHRGHVHGKAAAKKAAVALAFDMIRDGPMPSPERAKEIRKERLERRRQQPAALRRRAEARQRGEQESQAWRNEWEMSTREAGQQPLYEMLHEIFDFADPELWKSNSFAAMRPRLIVYLAAVVAKLEREQLMASHSLNGRNRNWYKHELARLTPRLTKAREILELLHGKTC
jgi:hypothetical protein